MINMSIRSYEMTICTSHMLMHYMFNLTFDIRCFDVNSSFGHIRAVIYLIMHINMQVIPEMIYGHLVRTLVEAELASNKCLDVAHF